ncbi:helix-turn-helix domain-containing protein [Sphingomonas swuensis]
MARDVGHVRAFKLSSEACPIPAAIQLIGERWTCLILRGAMLGLCHFEEFQACLGIARNILSDRLARLVRADILARTPDPHDRRKVIYALTERGAGLLPVLVAIRQWGLEAGLGKPSHPALADRRDRRPVAPLSVRAHDGRVLAMEDLVWIGADGEELAPPLPPLAKRDAA